MTGGLLVWTCADSNGTWAKETGIATVSRTYRHHFARIADRFLALGTPEEVVATLRRYEATGADRIILAPACPAADRARVVRVLADEVLPAVRV
ncbi:hypothetical protein [Pseudonocardia sp. NPDC049154]|uniref:hypothetical protein n=1 Tax=Pseudonocardia sp. NPDC049154 TaxID=3155501 RepID=UPI0033ED9D26